MQAPPALMALVISAMVRRFSSLILRRMYGSLKREALADDAAFFLLVGVDVDAQLGQVDAALLGPVENGRFQGLGPHHRAVDLLLRQPAEEIDDVLVLTFRAWIGVKPPCSISVQRASEAAIAEVQPKVR